MVEEVVGPTGQHGPDRKAVRHGTQQREVTLGERRMRVEGPRVRATDG